MQCPTADCASFILMPHISSVRSQRCESDAQLSLPAIWFRVIATATEFTINNGKAYAGPGAAKANTKHYAVYSGACAELNLISSHTLAENASATVTGLTVGKEYLILASAACGAEKYNAISTCITSGTAYEANGNYCSDALAIRLNSVYAATNAGATPDGPEYKYSLENNTWYKWIVPSDWPAGQSASIRVYNTQCNSNEDIQITLWSTDGSCPDDHAVAAVVPLIPGDRKEYFYQWTPAASKTVYVSVDGFAGFACNFNLEIREESKAMANVIGLDVGSDGQAILLNWVTSGEDANEYFTIEKSRDGRSYLPLDNVPGAGNASSERNYSYRDEYPFAGISYYRLRMTDPDANYTYSKAIAIHVKGEGQLFHAWTSSMGENIDIAYFSEAETEAMLRIYNETGMQVYNMPLQFTLGRNDYRINSRLFPEGNYKVRLETPDTIHFGSVSLESE